MTEIRAKAIQELKTVPEDQMAEVIDFIAKLKSKKESLDNKEDRKRRKAAFERFQKYRKSIVVSDDYNWKDDLTEALWEKYESIN